MAANGRMAPPFQELTRLLLHNVRYYPGIVSRKNLDDFIVMVQEPVRLAHVYDQLEFLRQDLKMGNIGSHDEVVYLVALTKHLPDPRHECQYQITRPPATRASSQRLVNQVTASEVSLRNPSSSGGAGSTVRQSAADSDDGVE